MGLGRKERGRIEEDVREVLAGVQKQFLGGAREVVLSIEPGLVGSLSIPDSADLVGRSLREAGFAVVDVSSQDWSYGARVVVAPGNGRITDATVDVGALLPPPLTAKAVRASLSDVAVSVSNRAIGLAARAMDPTHGRATPHLSVLTFEALAQLDRGVDPASVVLDLSSLGGALPGDVGLMMLRDRLREDGLVIAGYDSQEWSRVMVVRVSRADRGSAPATPPSTVGTEPQPPASPLASVDELLTGLRVFSVNAYVYRPIFGTPELHAATELVASAFSLEDICRLDDQLIIALDRHCRDLRAERTGEAGEPDYFVLLQVLGDMALPSDAARWGLREDELERNRAYLTTCVEEMRDRTRGVPRPSHALDEQRTAEAFAVRAIGWHRMAQLERLPRLDAAAIATAAAPLREQSTTAAQPPRAVRTDPPPGLFDEYALARAYIAKAPAAPRRTPLCFAAVHDIAPLAVAAADAAGSLLTPTSLAPAVETLTRVLAQDSSMVSWLARDVLVLLDTAMGAITGGYDSDVHLCLGLIGLDPRCAPLAPLNDPDDGVAASVLARKALAVFHSFESPNRPKADDLSYYRWLFEATDPDAARDAAHVAAWAATVVARLVASRRLPAPSFLVDPTLAEVPELTAPGWYPNPYNPGDNLGDGLVGFLRYWDGDWTDRIRQHTPTGWVEEAHSIRTVPAN